MRGLLWRKGLPADRTLGRVDYMGVPDGASAHPACKKMVSIVVKILGSVYFENDSVDIGQRTILTIYQKVVALIENLVYEVAKSEYSVLGHFAGTISIAKVCQLPEQNRWFSGI